MTTQEIQDYMNTAIRSKFEDYSAESMEMMTSEGGDGRFLGKVFAIRYLGLPESPEIYLAIGTADTGAQIVRFGMSECLVPSEGELDLILQKELGIE